MRGLSFFQRQDAGGRFDHKDAARMRLRDGFSTHDNDTG